MPCDVCEFMLTVDCASFWTRAVVASDMDFNTSKGLTSWVIFFIHL